MKFNRVSISIAIITILLGIQSSPTFAVENGQDSSGDSYVIPIYNEDAGTMCSGALLTPKVVVTVAHCVMGKNGMLSTKVWVGSAGKNVGTATAKTNLAESIELTPTYADGTNGTVVADDLAFIILTYHLIQTTYVHLASEDEIAAMKRTSVGLKAIGYGTPAPISTASDMPNNVTGNYLNYTYPQYPNSGILKSTIGGICKGDSGGPVFRITATRITLVGVITGSMRDSDQTCAKKQSDGTYLATFTETSKYANLAFDASNVAASSITKFANMEFAKDDKKMSDLASQIAELESSNAKLVEMNSKLSVCISAFKKATKAKKFQIPKGC